MKIADALTLLQTIEMLQKTSMARKFKLGYMLAYNKLILQHVQESFKTAITDPDEDAILLAFEKDRIASLEEVAVKGPDGMPLIENNAYVIADQSVYPMLEAKLNAAHPKAFEAMRARHQRIDELGQEDQDITLRTLPLAEWPDLPETLPTSIMDQIQYLISEEA